MATSSCRPSSLALQVSCIFFFVSSFLLLLPLSESLYFNITRFEDNATNIRYSGDAVPEIGTIEFNQVNYDNGVGQAIYSDTVQIWDRKSRRVSNFTSRFAFIMDTQAQAFFTHGFTFFLRPGSFQAPYNSSGSLRNPPYGHVGTNENLISLANYTSLDTNLLSGDLSNVWVAYNATTQILNLSWSYRATNDSRENTSLSYQVDLREVLSERVIVGFAASTGSDALQHCQFNSSLELKSEDNSNEWKLAMGLAVVLGVLVLGGIGACVIFSRRQRKATQKSFEIVTLTSMMNNATRGAGPKRFSYEDLACATNNFSDDKKLGVGGFGCVYKGYLSVESMVVAVKKNSQGSKQGKKEYITEVKIISRLRHRNLVQLIGWCHNHTQLLLVYEFMPNGGLDSHLFGKKSPLEWAVRYKIAIGLASALLYLHEEWEQCVVHRDIKTSNIMLDLGFNVKLGDFGLARLRDHELGPQTTGLAGTLGYMAPEYVMTGRASKESDMYSFGVVALEIASGRKVTDSVDPKSYLGLVQWVWDLFGKGELLMGVDQKLNNKFDAKQVKCLMMVGLWSAHPDWSLRPSIRQAIQVLKFESAAPNLPMKMPVATYYTTPDVPKASSRGATMTYTSIDLVR